MTHPIQKSTPQTSDYKDSQPPLSSLSQEILHSSKKINAIATPVIRPINFALEIDVLELAGKIDPKAPSLDPTKPQDLVENISSLNVSDSVPKNKDSVSDIPKPFKSILKFMENKNSEHQRSLTKK